MSRALRSLVAVATVGLSLVGCSGGGGSTISTGTGVFATPPVNPTPTPTPAPTPSPFPPGTAPTGAGSKGGGGSSFTPLSLTKITPNAGPEAGGNKVTITGNGMSPSTDVVKFVSGGVTLATISGAASFIAPSGGTALTFVMPAIAATSNAVKCDVVVTQGTQSQSLTGASGYAYQPLLGITNGPFTAQPGNTITIQGNGFQGVNQVIFTPTVTGSAPLPITVAPTTVVTTTSPNTLTVVVPAGLPSTTGTSATSITLKNSSAGTTSAPVTLTVPAVRPAVSVAFGSLAPSQWPYVTPGTSTLIVTVLGGVPAGYADVDAFIGGAANIAVTLSVNNPPSTNQGVPTADLVNLGPSSPLAVVPTLVTATASSATYNVNFAALVQNTANANSDPNLKCDVSVQTALQGTIADAFAGGNTGFLYISPGPPPVPALGSISPTHGPQNGGTPVTITGQFLGTVNQVTFSAGGTSYNLVGLTVSATQITGTTPQVAAGGTYSVVAKTGLGQTSNSIPFTFDTGIIISSLSPDSGSVSNPGNPGGVTINGDNFLDVGGNVLVAGISFGAKAVAGTIGKNNPLAAINVVSKTQLQIGLSAVPTGTRIGPVDVTITGVTSPTPTASAVARNGFYYGGALNNPVASLTGNATFGVNGAQALAVNASYATVVTNNTGRLTIFDTPFLFGGGASPIANLTGSGLASPIDVKLASFFSVAAGTASGDAAVLNSDGTIGIFTSSSGTWAYSATLASVGATTFYSFDVGDVDGDGYDDVVIVNDKDQIFVYLNDGKTRGTMTPGSFTTAVKSTSSAVPGFAMARQHVKIAGGTGGAKCGCSCDSTIPTDMNRDNVADLVVTKDAGGTNSANVSVWLGHNVAGHGDGTFTLANGTAVTLDPNNPNVTSIVLGDVDKSATTDVVVGANGGAGGVSPSVTVCSGDGFGGVSLYLTKSIPGVNPLSLVLGDVNFDCTLDLVAAQYNSDQIAVLIGTGDGTFADPVQYFAEVTSLKVGASTVNANTTANIVSVATYDAGDGIAGVFALDQQTSATVGQAVVTHMSRTIINAYFGFPTAAGAGNSFTTLTGGVDPSAIAFGQIDGSGHMGFAVCDRLSQTVEIYKGDGHENFTLAQSFATGPSPESLCLVPLTAAGYLDLVVCCAGGGANDRLDVYTNQGNGTFTFQKSYTTSFGGVQGQTPVKVISTEVNGDGFCDVVTVNQVSNNISIFLGTHTASDPLSQATHLTVGLAPLGIAQGALGTNAHGGSGRQVAMDLVTCNSSSGDVSVLLNNGTGASPYFSSVTQYSLGGTIHQPPPAPGSTTVPPSLFRDPLGIQPHAVAIADLNLDGAPDIITADSGSGTITILYGKLSVPVSVNTGATTLTAGDILVGPGLGLTPPSTPPASGPTVVTVAQDAFLSTYPGGFPGTYSGTIRSTVSGASVTVIVDNVIGGGIHCGNEVNASGSPAFPGLAAFFVGDAFTTKSGSGSGTVLGPAGTPTPTGTFFVPTNYYAIGGAISGVGNPPVILNTSLSTPTVIDTFDMNGDGYPDIIVGDKSAGIVTFINQGLAGQVYGVSNGVGPTIFMNGLVQSWSNTPSFCSLAAYFPTGATTPSFEGGPLYVVCPAGEMSIVAPGPLGTQPYPAGTGYPIGLLPLTAQLHNNITSTLGVSAQISSIFTAHTTTDCPPSVGVTAADGSVKIYKAP